MVNELLAFFLSPPAVSYKTHPGANSEGGASWQAPGHAGRPDHFPRSARAATNWWVSKRLLWHLAEL